MAQEIADSKLLDTWGSSGAKIEPDISKIIEGWQLGEQPPHEYMNWLQNTFGSKLNHILKNGVAKWNDETQYLAGSGVQHNGNVWLCKTTNTNSEPTDVNSNWKRIITVESLTTVLDGYVKQSANLSDLADIATARTNLGLGTSATRDVGTGSGQVMEVGAFGLGGINDLRGTVYTTGTPTDLYGVGYVVGFTDGSLLTPAIGGVNNYGTLEIKVTYIDASGMIAYSRSFATGNRVFIQQATDANTWGSWLELVSTDNNQTIAGVKTFSSSPIVPTPTTNTQVANKAYVDSVVGGATFVANDTRVKTALNATGTAPIYACRAWVNFNGIGTVAIRASGNVSSITDFAVGQYRVNFATAMIDGNYSVSATTGATNGNHPWVEAASYTDSTVDIYITKTTTGISGPDVSHISCNVFR